MPLRLATLLEPSLLVALHRSHHHQPLPPLLCLCGVLTRALRSSCPLLLPCPCVQTAEAPPDMAAAGEEQLQRFLLQAGWTPEAVWGLAGHEALVEAARASR